MQRFPCKYMFGLYCTVFANLLAATTNVSGQNLEIDSLKKALPNLKDTLELNCLNRLCAQYLVLPNKDSADYYADFSLRKAEKMGYADWVGKSLTLKARIALAMEANFSKAERLGKQALECFEKKVGSQSQDDLYVTLWISSFSQGKYEEAVGYARKRYDDFVRTGNNEGLWDALHMLAIVYKESGDYGKSFFYNCRAYEIATKYKREELSLTLFVFGELYMAIGDYQTSLIHFQEGFRRNTLLTEKMLQGSRWFTWIKMEYAEVFSHMHQFDSAWHYYSVFEPSKEDSIDNRIYLISTGEYYLMQQKFSNALENFLRGLQLHEQVNDVNQIMRAKLDIAKTYLGMGRDSLALAYGTAGLQMASKKNAKQFLRDGYQILFAVYDHLGLKDSANYYFRRFSNMRDLVADNQTQARFAAYTYEQKISLLNKDKQIKEGRLRYVQQQKKFFFIAISILLLAGVVLLRNILLKRKNETSRRMIAEQELRLQTLEVARTKAEFQQEISALEMQALRSQMNPHFIFNSLNSINAFILENNRLLASEYLTKFSRLVRLILQNSEMAYISLDSELQALKLYLELEALRLDNHFDYKVEVQEGIDPLIIKVPPLIIQPYVENAIWHGLMHKSVRGNLEVHVSLQDGAIVCKVRDDGVGRMKAAEIEDKSPLKSKSMGMKITAARISMLERQFRSTNNITIIDLVLGDGSPGGTEVILKIPIQYD